MSLRQKTLDQARQRTAELCRDFDRYAARFDAEGLFTGPSLYFHNRTLAVRRDCGGSVQACLKSEVFFELLYATLTSWGMHRMGPGNTKLVDLPKFVQSFQRMEAQLHDLERIRIEEILPGDACRMAEQIWPVIWNLHVGIGSTKIVSGTKALHHLLPDLVPPIDREYTVTFFLNHKNAVQGDEAKQREAFKVMYPHFVMISQKCKGQIDACLNRGMMNTSATKVIDNAIVGYGLEMLRLELGEPEN